MSKAKTILERSELSRSEIERLIDDYIFSERDRQMLKRRLLDGIVYEKLAIEFDLSTQQTKTIIYKAQERLFKHLEIRYGKS